jgi:hypothetical protein
MVVGKGEEAFGRCSRFLIEDDFENLGVNQSDRSMHHTFKRLPLMAVDLWSDPIYLIHHAAAHGPFLPAIHHCSSIYPNPRRYGKRHEHVTIFASFVFLQGETGLLFVRAVPALYSCYRGPGHGRLVITKHTANALGMTRFKVIPRL